MDHSDGGAAPEVFLADRLKKGREQLDRAMEALALLCEPVEPPKEELEHIHYFCGNTEKPDDMKERDPLRAALYKTTAALVRAYVGLADDLDRAGYDKSAQARIKERVDHYVKLRDTIRQASGENLDIKAYEADMRHLIDTYIEAKAPRKISPFDDISLLDLIVKTGIAAAINTRLAGLKGNKDAIAETIENNVRKKIIKEQLSDPAFFEKMSDLLDEIIARRKRNAIAYKKYLKNIAELVEKIRTGHEDNAPEALKKSRPVRAIYNKLVSGAVLARAAEDAADREQRALELAVRIDETVRRVKSDNFRGNQAKENLIKSALLPLLGDDVKEVELMFEIVKRQQEY